MRAYSVAARVWASSRDTGGISATSVVVIMCCPSLRGCPQVVGGDVLQEHLDGVVGEADPAVAAGVVGDLLAGQAGAEGGEQVDGPGSVMP
jgi:hypothetical protein